MSGRKSQPLYSVKFSDNSVYVGGTSFFDTKWKDMPAKNIERLFVRIPGGDHITLSGYDKYFFMIEATKDWARVNVKTKTTHKMNRNTPRLEYMYIMGKKKNLIVSYRISLKAEKIADRYKLGDITKRIYREDSDKIQKWGLNPNAWR